MLERILITDSSQWESPESMMTDLLCHNEFDTLMLRESWPIEVIERWVKFWQANSSIPVILNGTWTKRYLQMPASRCQLEQLLSLVEGLHIKTEEMQLLKLLSSADREAYDRLLQEQCLFKKSKVIGVPVHALEMVETLPKGIDLSYVLISPVRASACKVGVSPLSQGEQRQIIHGLKMNDFRGKTIALGGLNHMDLSDYKMMGYDGIAGRRGFLNY